MNAVVGQTLRCLIHETNDIKKWEILLPTIELAINSLPNASTGFTPFLITGMNQLLPFSYSEVMR